jgi:hypothetical protein
MQHASSEVAEDVQLAALGVIGALTQNNPRVQVR